MTAAVANERRAPTDRPAGGGDDADVEIVGVTKRFGTVTAVDHMTLRIEPGEFYSLLGPSGCGKTTTLRMIAGFEQPTEGEIYLAGQPVAGIPPYRRNVNTVFQHYALFPHMTVAENVAYGLRQKRVEKHEMSRRVHEALEMVKMTGLARRKPRQLSGGQQQRVAVARALVNQPSVLLLDEPLGALDRKLRQEMQIELKLLQSQLGITFLYVTHDQEEALSMSDRIAVMRDGRVEQLADPNTVYDEPVSAFVAGFIGQQNFFPGVVRDGGRRLDGDEVIVQAERASPDALDGRPGLGAVRPESVTVTDREPAAPANVVGGSLAGVSHLGDLIQLVVLTPNGREIVSRQPRDLAPRLERGTRVWCTWEPGRAQVFAADDSELVLGVSDAIVGEKGE